jgi:hypothetical protein
LFFPLLVPVFAFLIPPGFRVVKQFALQLRNLQTMAEISVGKNSAIIFPAQFMGTIDDVRLYD